MSIEDLVIQIQCGDQSRLLELWERVERFAAQQARSMAAKMNGRYGVTAEDLYQCGYIALCAAVETFSSASGKSFLGWFDFYLRKEFARWGGWYTEHRKSDPLNHALSLDAPLGSSEEDDTPLWERQPDPASAEGFDAVDRAEWNSQLRCALETAISEIPAKQGDVIRRRYFCGETFAEIAAVHGNTPSRIQQIEENALCSLRTADIARPLEKFLETRTPYYLRVGVEQFHRTRTSAVEKIALLRERLRQDYFQQERRSIWISKHD